MSYFSPSSLPEPTDQDLDFLDPPECVKDDLTKIFWCISSKVRDKFMENLDKHICFCFHNGFCTFQSDYDKATAEVRMQCVVVFVLPPTKVFPTFVLHSNFIS